MKDNDLVIHTMKDNDLVIAKKSFSELHNTEFKHGKIYRCSKMDGGYLVNGEWFNQKQFDNRFAPLINVVKAEWEAMGLTVKGKPISKTAFKKKADIHQYGRCRSNSIKSLYFYFKDGNELIYQFHAQFNGDSNKKLIDYAYNNFLECLNGDVLEWMDKPNSDINRGNKGIPIGWRDITFESGESNTYSPVLAESDGYKMPLETDDLPF